MADTPIKPVSPTHRIDSVFHNMIVYATSPLLIASWLDMLGCVQVIPSTILDGLAVFPNLVVSSFTVAGCME